MNPIGFPSAVTMICSRSNLVRSGRCIRSRKGLSFSSNATSDKDAQRKILLQQAGYMTRTLYRLCMKSTHVIRWGNEFDEMEFQKREEEFSNPTPGGSMSMAPPPNREDELRSRTEYYQSYARECFSQESDALDNDPLREKDVRRYLYYLRKAEKDRKWLLGDMMFADPYKERFDMQQIDDWEALAYKYLGKDGEEDAARKKKEMEEAKRKEALRVKNDSFFDDDEEEDPDWLKQKYPNLR
mmetsp:Transcript_10323/g.28404  ORF Transcript_10323/g.28404 Transcript_10323/m.28404 type:complete len:241 (-) Transcript_10323:192-914(-)